MKYKFYIIIASFFCIALQVNALTIDSILDSISNNNIELKAKIAETKSNIAEIKSGNNLGDTEFEFEYQKGNNINGNKYGFSVSQGFDWPGMYIARSNANKSKINAFEYEFLSRKLEVLSNAKQLCISIINANRKIQIQKDVYNNIKLLSDEYEKGFKHGEISILDINKLKIELLNVKQALDKSVTERNILIEELIAINGGKAISDIENMVSYPEQELKAFDIYENEITIYDPELNYNREMKNTSAKEISMAKMGWFPKFSVGYKFANELGDKFNGISIGMALPLFSNLNKVSMAKASLMSTEYTNHEVMVDKTTLIKTNYARAVYLKSQIYSYSSILSDSSNKLMLKKALDGGQITLLNYLLELRYFLEAQQTLLNLEYEYNSVLTTLNKYNILQ